MGKRRDPAKYLEELSNSRKRLQDGKDQANFKKWTGGKLTPRPNLRMERFRFQDKPMKEKAKTIRNILKQAHPKHKFSVRSDAISVDINWTDGPSVKTINKLQLGKMRYPQRDGRGGVEHYSFIASNRKFSPERRNSEAHRILSKWADVKDMTEQRKQEIVYREMYQTDYPGAKSPKAARLMKGHSTPRLAKVSGVARSPKKV